jgi:hypothetical protein
VLEEELHAASSSALDGGEQSSWWWGILHSSYSLWLESVASILSSLSSPEDQLLKHCVLYLFVIQIQCIRVFTLLSEPLDSTGFPLTDYSPSFVRSVNRKAILVLNYIQSNLMCVWPSKLVCNLFRSTWGPNRLPPQILAHMLMENHWQNITHAE